MNTRVRLVQRWLSLLLIVLIWLPLVQAPVMIQAQNIDQEQASTNQDLQTDVLPTEVVPEEQTSNDLFDADINGLFETSTLLSETPDVQYDPNLREKALQRVAEAEAAEADQAIQAEQGTGVVFDVSVPVAYRHGEFITYTYSYNNSSTSAASITLELVWTEFSYRPSGAGMWCADYQVLPECKPALVQGPTPSYVGQIQSGVKYAVDLPAGTSGRFSIVMQSNNNIYPRANIIPVRPTTSLRGFVNGSVTPQTKTVSTLLVGPVLSISKTAIPTGAVIYPEETAFFRIDVKNFSTAERVDSRAATNVLISDTLPLGTQVISASVPYQTAGNAIYWEIPVLEAGTTWSAVIAFYRPDVIPLITNVGTCREVKNEQYFITSSEYPIINGIRETVRSGPASVRVAIPLEVEAVLPDVFLGSNFNATLRVRSFWDQPIEGLRLEYNIQENATYVGPTNPPATTEPTTPSGTIAWVFDMEAASKTTPKIKEFIIPLRMGDRDTTPADAASISLILPAGSDIPSTCIQGFITDTNNRNGGIGPSARARFPVTMTVTSDSTNPRFGSSYIVERGEEFPVIITIKNPGGVAYVADSVTLHLPNSEGANLSYVPNSALLNGAAREPNSILNGNGGSFTWNNIPIAANGDTIIRLRVFTNGFDVIDYCMFGTAQIGERQIGTPPTLCITILPDISVTKTVDKLIADPGESVTFNLTLTNNENTPYEAGLMDLLFNFVYVEQIEGYAAPDVPSNNQGVVLWPRKVLQPGETVSVTFVARVPGTPDDPCDPRDAINEVGYHDENGTLVIFVPRIITLTRIHCHQIRYGLNVLNNPVSLRDVFRYEAVIDSRDEYHDIPGAQALVVLPLDFSYVSMDDTSDVTTAPDILQNGDGTTTLRWNIASVPQKKRTFIRFNARSSSTVGRFRAKLYVSVSEGKSICGSVCIQSEYEGQMLTFSEREVEVRPLITVEPTVDPTTCVEPGAIVRYRVQLFSIHSGHGYPDTVVNVYLPLGLRYIGTDGRRVPSATILPDGRTKVTWTNLDVPVSPNNGSTSLLMELKAQVDNSWSDLSTEVEALSDYGLIPLKDEINAAPAIIVCPQQPSVAKLVDHKIAKVGDVLKYQISVANTNATELTATIEDELPSNMSFVQMLSGPQPTVSGNTLSWDLTLPGVVAGETKTVTKLIFEAQVDSAGSSLTQYTNTATVTTSSETLDTTYASAVYSIPLDVYFPAFYRPSVGTRSSSSR